MRPAKPGVKISQVLPRALLARLQVGVAMELGHFSTRQAASTVQPIHVLTDSELAEARAMKSDNAHVCLGGKGLQKAVKQMNVNSVVGQRS